VPDGAVLSIQSRVSYGYVGNSAAAFALQRLGREVWTVDTVHFSNHPGYGAWVGTAATGEAVRALVDGIGARGVFATCNGVLSGYLGAEAVGEAVQHAVAQIRAANPAALFCCDPVIGDTGAGVYVRPGIPGLLRSLLVPAADILTPNQFELQHLTGLPAATLAELQDAVAGLRAAMRPGAVVLVTSVRTTETPDDAIDMLGMDGSGCWRMRTELLPIAPSGAGDLATALFLHHRLGTSSTAQALQATGNAVFGVLERTVASGQRELRLIAAQDEIVAPSHRFSIETC